MLENNSTFSFRKVHFFISVFAFILSIIAISIALKQSKNYTEKVGFGQNKIQLRQADNDNIHLDENLSVDQKVEDSKKMTEDEIKFILNEATKRQKNLSNNKQNNLKVIEKKHRNPVKRNDIKSGNIHVEKKHLSKQNNLDIIEGRNKIHQSSNKSNDKSNVAVEVNKEKDIKTDIVDSNAKQEIVQNDEQKIESSKKIIQNTGGSFVVQTGSFLDPESAGLQDKIVSEKIQNELKEYNAKSQIKSFGEGNNAKHKSFITSFETKKMAQEFCDKISEKGINCFTVKLDLDK